MDPADHQLLIDVNAKFIGLAEALGSASEDFDDIVHDCAADRACRLMNQTPDEDEKEKILCEWEDVASDINDNGLESQIAFLLRYGSSSELIDDFARLWKNKGLVEIEQPWQKPEAPMPVPERWNPTRGTVVCLRPRR